MFFRPNFTIFNKEIATHAQVDEKAEIRKTQNEKLGTPRDFLDFLSLNLYFEFSGRRKS
jgi:hypothetical protein